MPPGVRRDAKVPRSRWPIFIAMWNGDEPSSAMRERFGIKSPGNVAKRLRLAGVALKHRGPTTRKVRA